MHGHKSLLEGQKAKALPTREGPKGGRTEGHTLSYRRFGATKNMIVLAAATVQNGSTKP